jgi:hypothetical protein
MTKPEPAFPQTMIDSWDKPHVCGGMTLRDYFAAKAMAALLSDYSLHEVSLLATDAYNIADAMLAERTE